MWNGSASGHSARKKKFPTHPHRLIGPGGGHPLPPGRDSRDVKGFLETPLGGSAALSRGRALPPGISGIEIPGRRASGRVRSPETFRGRGPGTFPTEVTLGSHPKEEELKDETKPFPSARKQRIFVEMEDEKKSTRGPTRKTQGKNETKSDHTPNEQTNVGQTPHTWGP